MNAQVEWKRQYKVFLVGLDISYIDNIARRKMYRYRREAALERKLAAAEREIDSLRHVAHRAVSHVGAANYAEREQEAHDWIDAV